MVARSTLLAATLCAALLTLHGCAAPPRFTNSEQARLSALLPADVLLLGEQHDAPEHQHLQRNTVQWLAAQGQLAAVAMEMAERGRSTAGLPASASQSDVRAALAWHDAGWPWSTYGPVVMAAVRAGVPVLGANLPMARLRDAMGDAGLDARLPPDALRTQQRRIREGHCHALPETQIAPMTRVQIARDVAMADTVRAAAQAGRTVLLVAGNGHVQRDLGVPLHLPREFKAKVVMAQADPAPIATQSIAIDTRSDPRAADLLWPTPPTPARDYCADFKPKPRPASTKPSAPSAPR